jgi:hypothetical protein
LHLTELKVLSLSAVLRREDIFRTRKELSLAVFWLGIFLNQDFVNCTSSTLPAVTQFGADLSAAVAQVKPSST